MVMKTVTFHSCCVNITQEGLSMAGKQFSKLYGGKKEDEKLSHSHFYGCKKTYENGQSKIPKAREKKPLQNT